MLLQHTSRQIPQPTQVPLQLVALNMGLSFMLTPVLTTLQSQARTDLLRLQALPSPPVEQLQEPLLYSCLNLPTRPRFMSLQIRLDTPQLMLQQARRMEAMLLVSLQQVSLSSSCFACTQLTQPGYTTTTFWTTSGAVPTTTTVVTAYQATQGTVRGEPLYTTPVVSESC